MCVTLVKERRGLRLRKGWKERRRMRKDKVPEGKLGEIKEIEMESLRVSVGYGTSINDNLA